MHCTHWLLLHLTWLGWIMTGPNMTEMCWCSVPGSCAAVFAVVAMLLATAPSSRTLYRDSRSSKPPLASIF